MEETIEKRNVLESLLISGTDADIVEQYATLAKRAETALFGVLEPEYVVVDTETTGFDPKSDALIEIAAAIICGPDVIDRFSTFVNPKRPIPEEITELTGISDDDVRDAPDAINAVSLLMEFVGDRKIIAHNAAFDRAFIVENALFGSDMLEEKAWIDSLELARIALPRFREHNLAALSRAFVDIHSTHRAIDDVEALCKVWRVLLLALSDLPLGLPGFLSKLYPQTQWSLRSVLNQIALQTPDTRFSLKDVRETRTQRLLSKKEKVDAIELADGSLTLKPVSAEEVTSALSKSGAAGLMYARYEQRDEQVAMAQEVALALNTSTHRAIEAGTGVGKSMAYLLPQALFALRNGVTCGVATKTNALLDQLMYHELPRLKQAIDDDLQYVALKGYDHYVCLRKLMHFAGEDRDFSSAVVPVTVASLLAFTAQSSQGDLDPLPLSWRDFPRFEVCATPDDCLHHKCRYYSCCMLHGVRRAARHADIVVTNHSLLFCDVMMTGSVLPPIRHWVVDEAHSVETEARHQLSVALDARTLMAELNELLHPAGILHSMRRQALPLAGGDVLVGKIDSAQADARSVSAISESFFSFVKDLESLAERNDYDTISLWINERIRDSGAWGVVAGTGKSMAGRLESLWRSCRDIVTYSGQFPDLLEIQSDLAGLVATLRMQLDALILILDGDDRDYVYYAEIDRRQNMQTDRLIAAQIDIGAALLERFFPEEMSVVFTSATIATGESFDYFAHNCGLDRIPEERWSSLRLASSYDFEKNMAVYLPSDIPEPAANGYIDALDELLYQVHIALGGSVLTLFTNRRDMNLLYGRLKKRLEAEGIKLRSQSKGSSAKRLRDEFLADTAMSLFALRSFWEGFDAPGDTLRCVVIPKLPFGKPTDPLQQERALREQNAWNRYSLPEAIIDLKQAAGRLIRSSTDRGCLVLADSRLLSKRYGTRFLEALPSQQRYIMDSASVAVEIRRTLG